MTETPRFDRNWQKLTTLKTLRKTSLYIVIVIYRGVSNKPYKREYLKVGNIEVGQKGRNLFSPPKPDEDRTRPEWRVQAEAVSYLHKLQDMGKRFEFAGDMNGEIRNGTRAKLTGVKAGETDLRFYFPGGLFKMIELKRTSDGKLSKAQKERHPKLRALGFEIEVVWAEVEDVAEKIAPIIERWLKESERCLN